MIVFIDPCKSIGIIAFKLFKQQVFPLCGPGWFSLFQDFKQLLSACFHRKQWPTILSYHNQQGEATNSINLIIMKEVIV